MRQVPVMAGLYAALGFMCIHAQQPERRNVFVSVAPQKYFVERIGGRNFNVRALIKPGQDPHCYSPAAEQIKALSEAALIFTIGVEFEKSLIPKVKKMMPELRIVDIHRGLKHGSRKHTGKKHGTHAHMEDEDPHVWLSPVLAAGMTDVIAQSLAGIYPRLKPQFDSAATALKQELDSLNNYLHGLLDPYRGSPMFVFHPAFGHFAREYGLVQVAVEHEGKEPGIKTLSRLVEKIQKSEAKVIFIQPQFTRNSAEAIAKETGCALMTLSPLPEDYFTDMGKLGEIVKAGLPDIRDVR